MTTGDNYTYELVIVSYLSRLPLKRLLDAVDGVSVIIVDNASGEDRIIDYATGRANVRYIDSGGNLGFAAAANLGVTASDADVVIFVNPDCLPTQPTLRKLAETLRSRSDVAACSPALRGDDGLISPRGGGSAPTLPRCLAHAVGLHTLFRRSGIWIAPRPGEVLDVEWLAGTCLAVRRSTFQEVGGFDEHYFLYNEDMALGDRFRRRGMRQLLRGDVAVEHHGGGSSAVSPVGLWLLRGGSLARYIDGHNRPAAARCMRAALCAGSLLRAAAYSAIPGRHHRRREMLNWAAGMVRPNHAISTAMTSLSGKVRSEENV